MLLLLPLLLLPLLLALLLLARSGEVARARSRVARRGWWWWWWWSLTPRGAVVVVVVVVGVLLSPGPPPPVLAQFAAATGARGRPPAAREGGRAVTRRIAICLGRPRADGSGARAQRSVLSRVESEGGSEPRPPPPPCPSSSSLGALSLSRQTPSSARTRGCPRARFDDQSDACLLASCLHGPRFRRMGKKKREGVESALLAVTTDGRCFFEGTGSNPRERGRTDVDMCVCLCVIAGRVARAEIKPPPASRKAPRRRRAGQRRRRRDHHRLGVISRSARGGTKTTHFSRSCFAARGDL